jgi:hypothetical protein
MLKLQSLQVACSSSSIQGSWQVLEPLSLLVATLKQLSFMRTSVIWPKTDVFNSRERDWFDSEINVQTIPSGETRARVCREFLRELSSLYIYY